MGDADKTSSILHPVDSSGKHSMDQNGSLLVTDESVNPLCVTVVQSSVVEPTVSQRGEYVQLDATSKPCVCCCNIQ